ncbi:MAG: hypothetical protein PPP58_01500 [Natronomonas sp.]
MSDLPEPLVAAVGDAPIVERIDIGGGDIIAVTPQTTFLYRSEGLLSDETVNRFDHDVEAVAVDVGRRKATIRLAGLSGETSMKIPSSIADGVVEAMLEGILRASGAVDADESVVAVFRFSDLTLVVTETRLLKHVGTTVWDEEFEAIAYDDVTDLDFESGSVATQVVIQTDGRRDRVKVPNDQAPTVRQTIEDAIFEFHGVASLEELRAVVGETDDDEEAEPETSTKDETAFVSATKSLPADHDVVTQDTGGDSTAESGAVGGDGRDEDEDSAAMDDVEATEANTSSEAVESLAAEVQALSEQIERQTDLLEQQQATIEQLVEELRRGR